MPCAAGTAPIDPPFIHQDAAVFIRNNTRLGHAPLVPEFRLHLATEITPIWQATEDWLQQRNMAPPFWAFAWPGSQALARAILDDPRHVAGRRVLDFAAGCGLAALAAKAGGAARVQAAEIDPLAIAAIGLNAAENRLSVETLEGDVVGGAGSWTSSCAATSVTRRRWPATSCPG